jgi:hypothetical protein
MIQPAKLLQDLGMVRVVGYDALIGVLGTAMLQ